MSEAFKELCSILSCVTNLHISLQQDEFVVHTDAYGGIESVLSIIRTKEELPVGYYSKKLTEADRNYAVTEME